MLSERMLSKVVEACTANYLQLKPCDEAFMPSPNPGQPYMLYMHVPFCERLCPYCSFNRFPFREDRAKPYFQNMRREMTHAEGSWLRLRFRVHRRRHAHHYDRRAV